VEAEEAALQDAPELTDRTQQLVSSTSFDERRARLLQNKPDRWPSPARELGLAPAPPPGLPPVLAPPVRRRAPARLAHTLHTKKPQR
jgi:hypothetical protein